MLSTAEVASELYISVNTVKTHLKSIYAARRAARRPEPSPREPDPHNGRTPSRCTVRLLHGCYAGARLLDRCPAVSANSPIAARSFSASAWCSTCWPPPSTELTSQAALGPEPGPVPSCLVNRPHGAVLADQDLPNGARQPRGSNGCGRRGKGRRPSGRADTNERRAAANGG